MTDAEHRVRRVAAHVFNGMDPEIARSWEDPQHRQVGSRPVGRECASGPSQPRPPEDGVRFIRTPRRRNFRAESAEGACRR
jgi:hypothetical protein